MIILAVVGGLFLPGFNSDEDVLNESLSNEEVLEAIKPQIQSYCDSLDAEANYSHCVTCKSSSSLDYVESFDEG